jgi:hypothetical protein
MENKQESLDSEVRVTSGLSDQELKERQKAKNEKRMSKRKIDEMPMNITSLMDALTIMLFFLMTSIVNDPLNIKQDDAMMMATSNAEEKPASDSIPIVITKETILVDSEHAVDVECIIDGSRCSKKDMKALNDCEKKPNGDICSKKVEFRVSKQDKENANANSLVIVPLKKKLDKLVKQQIEQLEMRQNKKFEGVATLVVDKEIPFRLLTEVIYTAGRVGDPRKGGLAKFRFAIMRGL